MSRRSKSIQAVEHALQTRRARTTVPHAILLIGGLTLLCTALLGCSVQNDPTYNQYESDESRTPILQVVDDVLEAPFEFADQIDHRAEHLLH